MWSPTHVQVTVQKAWGLLTKGNQNTNDCFVTIALGKVKYQTSVKLKAGPSVEWHEECELPIPDQGNTAEVILTVLHRNFLGVDEFLGRIAIPLSDFDVYERPKNRWYKLESKLGKESKKKERGELEVKIAFTVKAGSLTDLSKKDKHKSSMGQLSQVAQSVGGSLLSIGSLEKRKGLKKFAKSIGSKINIKHKKKDGGDDVSTGSISSLKKRSGPFENTLKNSKQTAGDADPGVISEDEDDFTFDDLSHNSSTNSLNHNNPVKEPTITNSSNTPNVTTGESLENLAGGEILRRNVNPPPKKPPRFESKPVDEWEQKLYGKSGKNYHSNTDTLNRLSWDPSKLSSQIEEEEPQEITSINNVTTTTNTTTTNTTANESPKSVMKNKNNVKKEDKEERLFSKLRHFRKEKSVENLDTKSNSDLNERIIIGGENEIKSSPTNNRLFNEILQKFSGKTREDLIMVVCELQSDLDVHKKKLKDLEDYLDDLLLRVMETTPRILQNPYVSCKVSSHKEYRNYSK